jgi:hypothetical protein
MKISGFTTRAAVTAVSAAFLVPLAVSSVASASDNDTVPESREFIMEHSETFVGRTFGGPAGKAGTGYFVRNNVASVWNRHPTKTARVYVASYYQGAYDTIPPNTKRNLTTTYNRNASFQFLQP